MDYLDTKKEARNNIMLFIGYGTIAIAIAIATLVLVYQAYGFGLTRNGSLIQSGLTFFSSQPNATITIDGVVNKSRTNTRLALPEKIYHVVLSREGYRNWERTIAVVGGSVHHYDYPMLFPTTLAPKKIASLTTAPTIFSQSPDRRWILVQQPDTTTSFAVYDLKNIAKEPVTIQLPDGVAAKSTSSESWAVSEWSDDNVHVVLQHTVDGKLEYILLDRTAPEQSINLTSKLGGTVAKLTLSNRKYDKYYLQPTAGGELQAASLDAPTPETLLQKVLSYQTYDNDTVLYATSANAPAGKIVIKLRQGDQTYTLRSFPAGSTYPLNLTKYSGTLYVVFGASSLNKLYIYNDPIAQLNDQKTHSLVPSQVLNVVAPNYLSFSSNAQYILAENGTQFGVYDIENEKGYNYTAKQPLDAPAVHATWMDGNRITYVSNGKMNVFDYDYTNQQTLMPAGSSYLAAYSPDYKFIYNVVPQSGTAHTITQTSVLTPADQ